MTAKHDIGEEVTFHNELGRSIRSTITEVRHNPKVGYFYILEGFEDPAMEGFVKKVDIGSGRSFADVIKIITGVTR